MRQIHPGRLATLIFTAVLLAWAIFAPLYAYRAGHLAGYEAAVKDVMNPFTPRGTPPPEPRLVPSRDRRQLTVTAERTSKP